MKFQDLWVVLDNIHPLWINMNGDCEYFEHKLHHAICKYCGCIVEYVTVDGEGVLTIELKEER